jgi:lipopolysaccharide assembly outer membrane protein LptD (OstA)
MANVMNRFLGIALFALACALVATPACSGADGKIPTKGGELRIDAEGVEFDPASGIAKAKGTATKQVRVEYEGMTLDADEIMLNHKTKDVGAKGNVVFVNGDQVWKGDELSGNFGTRTFSCGVFDLKAGVWYGHADHAERTGDGTSEVVNPRISTCDYEHPHYSISAKRIVYYPNGKFRAYHTVYRVGNVPVFYWPLLLGDTTAQGGNIEIKPGFSSDWGPYLLLSRSHRIGEFGRTTFMLDLRAKNGVAVGNQTRLKLARSETDFLVYGMYDMDTPETVDGYNRRFASEDIRYRLSLYERLDLRHDLTFRGQVNAFSDIDMFEDWFKKEYDLNPQPYTYADLTWDEDAFSLSLAARPKVNSFYTAVEQLPELHLLVPRRQIFGSRAYFQSDLTFGHYTMDWREFDQPIGGGTDPLNADSYDSWRANWVNTAYAPFAVGEFQFVPRAGFQVVWYSDSSEMALTDPMLRKLYDHDNSNRASYRYSSLDEYDDLGGGTTNLAGELGLEVSTKLYRVWQDYKNGALEIDGLRHVLQPYVNYTYVSDPSEDRENLYYFDQNDRLVEMNFLRIGANQRLQTRRHGKIYTLARMQTYADFHFNKQAYYSPDACIEATEPDAEHGTLGNLANRIDVQPREGLGFWNTIVFDMDEGDLNRAELGMNVGRDERRQFSLAYVYRNSYVPRALYSMGSSLLDFTGENNLYAQPLDEAHWVKTQLTLPINAKTTGRITLAYDFVDGDLAHNSLEIMRDLHCWMGTLAVGQDNGDFFVSVMLSLKAFPGMSVGGGI